MQERKASLFIGIFVFEFYMPKQYIFADEAGDFEFSKKPQASKYFIISAVALDNCDVGAALLELRRKLVWEKQQLGAYFHASTDRQIIRDAVFQTLARYEFKIFAKILEKSKAQPSVRPTRERFYQYGWYYLFKFAAPKVVAKDSELMITTASVATKQGQKLFTAAVHDVLEQTVALKADKWVTDFTQAMADPCLQVADYCAWAIQRKWESSGKDLRSYDLIKDRIIYEYDLWRKGTTHFY